MLSYYTVTPLPLTQPTPQSVWRPHQPHPQPHPPPHPQPHPQPHRPINPYPDNHNSKRSTVRTTARTPSTTTSTTTTTARPSEILTQGGTTFGSAEGEKITEETEQSQDYETGLWVDVSTEPGLEGQVQRLRAQYLQMGVPRNYLTDQMIWKLMQARGGQSDDEGFHF